MAVQLLEYKDKILKIITLIAISFLYLGRSFNDFEDPFVKGDGLEYILMTEALGNHFSPNVTSEDLIKFKERYSKYHKWEDFNLRQNFGQLEWHLKNTKNIYKESAYLGFYCNKNQKWLCQHFSFYSLINLPAYKIFKNYGPLRAFYITNALMVIATCMVLLFFTPFSLFNQILSALSFCFSCCYWYLGWQHTEVYTSCVVALSFVALFGKRYYAAMLLLALGCLQNQPLILLFGLFALITLFSYGVNIKNLIKIGAISLLALLPPLYYYWNFETTNLIKDAGFLDTKYITVNRVTGFYTDFSQGMILTIPFILICYAVLWIYEIKKVFKRQRKFELTLLIPLAVLFISMTVSTMGNWNHGMAIINRYASWLSIVVMIHTFYLTNHYSNLKAVVLFNYFFVTQSFTTLYHQQFNKYDWSSGNFTPLSKWFIRNHENLYNPDPVIFAGRTPPSVELIKENSPIIYFHSKQVKKILVHREMVDNLINFGLSQKTIEKIKTNIHYNYDWGYIHMEDFNSTLKGEEIYNMLRQKKLDAVYAKIKGSQAWMEQIEQKAKDWGKTVEEVCRMDAEYIVSLEEKSE